MASGTKDMNEIMQYLLGILPEEARQRVEQRLLTDEDFFEELLVSEDELTDLYLNENLSSEDRDRFESHFLSTPERHQQLTFAKALSQCVAENSVKDVGTLTDTPPIPAVSDPLIKLTVAERLRAFWSGQTWALNAAMALAVVIIAGTVWYLFFRTPPPRTFATLTLAASASNRGEGTHAGRVKLPLAASALRISLTLPARATPAANYRVEWSEDNRETKPLAIVGRETKPLAIVGQDAQSVSVEIPRDQLARGPYILKLFMLDAAGTEQRIDHYFFTVE